MVLHRFIEKAFHPLRNTIVKKRKCNSNEKDKWIHVGDVMKMSSNIITELYQEGNTSQPKDLYF